MLITFKTNAYASITMLGDVGYKMLEMMGFGSPVPGAIDTEDVPAALHNLESALLKLPVPVEPVDDADDHRPEISLQTRAVPLLELLQAAVTDEAYVRWE